MNLLILRPGYGTISLLVVKNQALSTHIGKLRRVNFYERKTSLDFHNHAYIFAGGHVITPLPGCTPTKPGSACFPFFGVHAVILDEDGKELEGEAEGYIAFKKPWPGIMRTVYGNHKRFEETYFSRFPGYYMSGDGAKRDADGYIWITGRVDDMLNCSGTLIFVHLHKYLLDFMISNLYFLSLSRSLDVYCSSRIRTC